MKVVHFFIGAILCALMTVGMVYFLGPKICPCMQKITFGSIRGKNLTPMDENTGVITTKTLKAKDLEPIPEGFIRQPKAADLDSVRHMDRLSHSFYPDDTKEMDTNYGYWTNTIEGRNLSDAKEAEVVMSLNGSEVMYESGDIDEPPVEENSDKDDCGCP